MLPSKLCVEAIKQFEGFRCDAYEDPYKPGLWTVGYGTAVGVKRGDHMTQAEAEARLLQDLYALGLRLDRAVTVSLTVGQSDALFSLVYNVGIGKFNLSRLRTKLNALDPKAPQEFLDWCHDAAGHEVAGLKRRRNWEYASFVRDPWPPPPASLPKP